MRSSIRHIGLVVNDLNQAVDFWKKVMGFEEFIKLDESGDKIDAMIGLKNINLTTIKMKDKRGEIIELLKFKSHKDKVSWDGKPYSTGLTHIALNVESVEEIIEKIRFFGIQNSNKIIISEDSSVKVTYVNGPEGLLLELVEKIK